MLPVLLCPSLHHSVAVYAALVSVGNTWSGRTAVPQNHCSDRDDDMSIDKPITLAQEPVLRCCATQVLALEILILLLENPSDDSVEMAVEFCKEVGAFLQEVAPAGLHSVFERFRAILHEGAIDKRCQYMIEGLFAVRKVRSSAVSLVHILLCRAVTR